MCLVRAGLSWFSVGLSQYQPALVNVVELAGSALAACRLCVSNASFKLMRNAASRGDVDLDAFLLVHFILQLGSRTKLR